MGLLIQVCNVAEVMGGTGACAWTITRALADWRHVVVFPRAARPEVVREFAPAEVRCWPVVTAERVREEQRRLRAGRGVVVLLHNTGVGRVEGRLPGVVLQYVHSAIRPAGADGVRYCSRYLAERCGAGEEAVLYQAVPEPPRVGWDGMGRRVASSVDRAAGQASSGTPNNGREIEPVEMERRSLRRAMVVGRLCTPTAKKWPEGIVDWTADVARGVPGVRWEFVGCPEGLQAGMQAACAGEAVFHPASWLARGHLWSWDAVMYHHPTITETFGRVVAEGLRAGCVPVVDARGGFLEQVTRETGFVCRDGEEFGAALRRLRDDPVLRWRMSTAGRSRGREMFGEEALAGRLKGWMREAAGKFV